jgi:molecular chaperone IbpA
MGQSLLQNGLVQRGKVTVASGKREIPEAMKPRKIAIGSSAGTQAPLQIEGEKQDAA